MRLLPKGFWKGLYDPTPTYESVSAGEIGTMIQEAREWIGWAKEATERRVGPLYRQDYVDIDSLLLKLLRDTELLTILKGN